MFLEDYEKNQIGWKTLIGALLATKVLLYVLFLVFVQYSLYFYNPTSFDNTLMLYFDFRFATVN